MGDHEDKEAHSQMVIWMRTAVPGVAAMERRSEVDRERRPQEDKTDRAYRVLVFRVAGDIQAGCATTGLHVEAGLPLTWRHLSLASPLPEPPAVLDAFSISSFGGKAPGMAFHAHPLPSLCPFSNSFCSPFKLCLTLLCHPSVCTM